MPTSITTETGCLFPWLPVRRVMTVAATAGPATVALFPVERLLIPDTTKCARQRVASAFTLLELLVVLAIIGVLAALLFPALSASKVSARRIQCGNQLRQLGLAAHLYWDDNAGAAFRWRGPATNHGQIFWFGWLEDGAEGERKFDPTAGALFPYLGDRRLEICPAFRYSNPLLKLKASGASYGYGYNLALSVPLGMPPVDVNKITRPAELAVLADAAQVNDFQPPATPEHPRLEEFYYLSSNESTAHFRHRSTANVVFCDGHVSPENPEPGSLDPRLPKERIGRLRKEILLLQ